MRAVSRRLVLGGLAAIIAYPARASEVSTALVLAFDVSGSMTDASYKLQMSGAAHAFRHPDVVEAVVGGYGVAIAVLQWADVSAQSVTTPWTRLRTVQDCDALAAQLAGQERRHNSSTGLGAALIRSAQLLDECPWMAWRRIIDVSGDGPTNDGPPSYEARDRVVAKGITINGLPIGDVAVHYRTSVIGGPGAFLMPAENSHDFAQAIRSKIHLELS